MEESEFERETRFVSAISGAGPQAGPRQVLRSWVDKRTGAARHQLYVTDTHREPWYFWVRANDDRANPLEFVSIARDVGECSAYGGCMLTEVFGATLPAATLARGRTSGVCVKFYARSGSDYIVCLTPEEITAHLDAIAARRSIGRRDAAR